MTDIVERLRVLADEIERMPEGHWAVAACASLRNQITGKDIEIKMLREVLKELVDKTEGIFALVHSDPHQTQAVYPRFILNARAALEEKE